MRLPTFFLLLLATLAHSAEIWRTFTDKGGRTMEASVVKVEDSYAVLKLKANGREITLGFDKLSDEDVSFLNSYHPEEFPTAAATTPDLDGEPETGRLSSIERDILRPPHHEKMPLLRRGNPRRSRKMQALW